MSRRTIWRSAEICRDHRVCRPRRWRESLVELRRQVHVATDEPRKDEFLAKIDKLTARRRIDEAARHRLDPLAFDKNALLRFGLYVWIGEQNASVNNLRLRGPSRIVCHGLFRPKLTILYLSSYRSAVTSKLSDNPGPRRETGQHD